MARLLRLIMASGLTVLPTAATAQICSGFASLARGPLQVHGSAQFNDGAKSFSGGLAIGGSGVFGQLAIGTTSFDNLDGSSFSVSGGAGYQVSLDKRNIAHLCPIASVTFASGPNNIDVFGDGSLVLDLSETDFEFGIAFGAVASRSGQPQILPAECQLRAAGPVTRLPRCAGGFSPFKDAGGCRLRKKGSGESDG